MNDDFEKCLQRIAPREIPSAWRNELLGAAEATSSDRSKPRSSYPAIFSTLTRQLRNLPRPQQLSWGALAAIWIGIAALNSSHPAPVSAPTTAATRLTPETRQALRQQKLLLVELVGPASRPAADRNQPPRPQSRRRDESFAA